MLTVSCSSVLQGSDSWRWSSRDRAGRAAVGVLTGPGGHGGLLCAGVRRRPGGDPLHTC